jgi:hypothetical protein
MKLVLSSAAMTNTNHCPIGTTGAIVSSDWRGDVVGCSGESIRKYSTHFQTGLPSEARGNYEYKHL